MMPSADIWVCSFQLRVQTADSLGVLYMCSERTHYGCPETGMEESGEL